MGENQLERSLFFTQVTSWGWPSGNTHLSSFPPPGHPKQKAFVAHVCQIAQEREQDKEEVLCLKAENETSGITGFPKVEKLS